MAAVNLTMSHMILNAPGDHGWVLARSIGILAMQGGFALLEAGCVRRKNVLSILIKNTADITIAALAWW